LTIVVAKRAIHGGERAIQRGNSENPYYIPPLPPVLLWQPPARNPNTYINPKAANNFTVAKTQALPNSDSIQPLPPFLSYRKGKYPIFNIILPLPTNLLCPQGLMHTFAPYRTSVNISYHVVRQYLPKETHKNSISQNNKKDKYN
jgi:hypothetical protein